MTIAAAIQFAIHSGPLHRAILRGSARLVPAHLRGEWLAEWRMELWYATEQSPPSRSAITAFCLGSFHDALWLRRNAPLPRQYGALCIDVPHIFPEPPPPGENRVLESPLACLALLGFLAAVCISGALLLPAARHADRRAFTTPAVLFACAWLLVPPITMLSLGDYPADRNWLRRWLFLGAKTILVSTTVIFGALDIGSLGSSIPPLVPQLAFLGGFIAIRWMLLDQSRRCPICLRLLANPVRIGDRSRILLEWNGTELVCLRGHGLLQVPESPAIWFQRQRWSALDASWHGLFRRTVRPQHNAR